jgi:hypothetical protein
MRGKGSQNEIGTLRQSDAELLHAIRRDVRAVYVEVLKKPLPRDIQALLYRLDRVEDPKAQHISGRMLEGAD